MDNNSPNINVNSSPSELAEAIIGILDSKKAIDIKLLHVEEQTILADYFIICCGNSTTQIRALSNEIEYRAGLGGIYPKSISGLDTASWVVLDYSSVIVHIFDRQARSFYNLENLWRDSEEKDITPLLK